MNVLVACEESQRVCVAFRERGFKAFSCDILPCSGGHPEWHIKGNVIILLDGDCKFITANGDIHYIDKWDLIIAHPPCTYLTVTGNRWFNVDLYGDEAIERIAARKEAVRFFKYFVGCKTERVAIENPVGIMSTKYRKPDQIIQPYMFGEHARKRTCLWLKNLPLLKPTQIVDPGEMYYGNMSVGAHADGKDSNGKWMRFNDPELARLRATTPIGVANAMGDQWGEYIRMCAA